MYKKFLLGVFTSAISVGMAQERHADLSMKSQSDSLATHMQAYALRNTLWTDSLMPIYGQLSLGYGLQQGTYIPAQGADGIQTQDFRSQGSLVIKGVKLWGLFGYQRQQEDSTRWAHQTRNNNGVPYYYGSYGYNHYERNLYRLATTAHYDLTGRFSLFESANYRIGSHYATNDPRGSIGDFQLDGTLGLGYRWTETLQIGADLSLGYGQERVEIGYKNSLYTESVAQTPYLNYAISGYPGDFDTETTKQNYVNDANRQGGKLYLSLQTAIGRFHASASRSAEQQAIARRLSTEEVDEPLNDYDIQKNALDLLWYLTRGSNQWMASLRYDEMSGRDYVYSINTNNYVYDLSEIQGSIQLQRQSRHYTFTYGANAIIRQEGRKDGYSGNDVSYANGWFQMNLGARKQGTGNSQSALQLRLIYNPALSQQFTVPQINETLFTQYVIYHDYVYYASSNYGAGIQVSHHWPLEKKLIMGVKLDGQWLHSYRQPQIDRTVLSLPGRDRSSLNMAIQFFF